MFPWRGRITSTWKPRRFRKASSVSSITLTPIQMHAAETYWRHWRPACSCRCPAWLRPWPPCCPGGCAAPGSRGCTRSRAEATPEQTALASDLHWLIHEGHVIEFANGILKRPKSLCQNRPSRKRNRKAPAAVAQPAPAVPEATATGEPAIPDAPADSAETVATPEQTPAAPAPSRRKNPLMCRGIPRDEASIKLA